MFLVVRRPRAQSVVVAFPTAQVHEVGRYGARGSTRTGRTSESSDRGSTFKFGALRLLRAFPPTTFWFPS